MDRFREINFRYLMTGADAVLADMARRIANAARPGDFVARDGGDQITLVLADTDQAEGVREAERLREVIARDPVIVDGEPIRVTACVGVATATFEEADSFHVFYRGRDAVHAAKDAGRNRVAVG
jgi:two-component system cell cycle response regulator